VEWWMRRQVNQCGGGSSGEKGTELRPVLAVERKKSWDYVVWVFS
jgi:hypothetical protein